MPNYIFACDSGRDYYDVPARSEEEALALLNDDPDNYRSGHCSDAGEFELIDVEG